MFEKRLKATENQTSQFDYYVVIRSSKKIVIPAGASVEVQKDTDFDGRQG